MKLTILIPSPDVLQRFYLAGAFDIVKAKNSVSFLVPHNLTKENSTSFFCLEKAEVHYLMCDERTIRTRQDAWLTLFNASCFSPEYQGTPFERRYSNIKDGKLKPAPFPEFSFSLHCVLGLIRRGIGNLVRCIEGRRYFAAIEKNVSKLGIDGFRQATVEKVGLNNALKKELEKLSPDLLIIPSSLTDWLTIDAIQISKEKHISTLVLQSGWDNLSSKGILPFLPDYIGVWGEQSARHANIYQKMPRSRIFSLGAPHYEHLKIPANISEFRSNYATTEGELVVLFGGSFQQFDEVATLKIIERLIEENKLPPMKIIYRPHPWRANRFYEDNFFSYAWKHTVMDKEIECIYKIHKKGKYITGSSFLFSMDSLNDLYKSVDAVITPLSTLLLESLLVGKPVFAVAFNDGRHAYSADYTAQMAHFAELKDINESTFAWCSQSKLFEEQLINFFKKSIFAEQSNSLLATRQNIIVFDQEAYSMKLNRLVESLELKNLAEEGDKLPCRIY